MDARHEMSVEHARLLSGAGGYATMDNSATGHPNSQQLRPPYGELCRPPGSDASTLSAAYHSRYLASMPLSTGSTFPFLGGMFTGTLPGPPSPFRAPSTPGVNNMRFWPPTPPPDGYGRYSMNTSLFPLFGAPSPDSGAYLSQGLVSRIGSTTHLSPVIDHKEHSFFTHGIGLGSPLTPTSHVTSPSPFPHLIPSLERHPAYIGHMTLGSKELEECYNEEEVRLLKSHMDCLMNQDMPPSRQERLKSKGEGKQHCCEKVSTDDCCKLSNTKTHGSSKMDGKGHHQPTNKVHPCKIEVSHSPALKPDMLSPPIESPKPERASPCRNLKKSAVGPVQPSSVTNHNGSLETRCSQCSASMKDVVVGSKASGGSVVSTAIVTPNTESFVSKNCSSSTVAMFSMTYSDSRCSPVSVNHSRVAAEHVENKHNNQKSPRTSPVITITDAGDRPSDSTHYKPRSAPEIIPTKSCNVPPVPFKHVTAAVIPTAPKQAVHREIHPETNCLSIQDLTKETPSTVVSEANNFNSDNHNVKLETSDTSGHSDKTASSLNQSSSPVCNAAALKSQNKNLSTSCKVKDMIRHASSAKQSTGEKLPEASPSKNTEIDGCSRGLLPNSPSKSVPFNVLPSSVSPTNLCKSPCQTTKSSSPIMKAEMVGSRQDCEFSQKSTSWTKATVMPFSWQNNSGHDDQAINLTVSKKPVKPEPNEALNQNQDTRHLSVKVSSESTLTNTEVIGVCHPTPSPVAVNKVKGTPAVSSISNFSAISVLNQPVEQSTEVHILHRSSKSSFPIVNRNATPPVPLKSTISHVTANTSIHRSVKAERLTSKRGKLGDADKLNHSRAALATLAPKLSKGMGFGKDVQTSHTLSASSSVSSTSIVFPATVNPCIPVGIAIAQQRQDTSANMGKAQQSVPSSVSNVITPNQHLATSRVAADLQAQEILAEQKNQDLSCSNNPTPVDTNLLVTQGPTIVSRQWESEALTRTAMPSASWLTHGSMVAPAVWLGQNAYTAAPTTNTVPSIAMNPLEPSPISLPPGGYQLARDISGHLLLIPTANIELMDRPSVWPSFNTSAGNLPIQQLVTQQQHTQFEQVLPHAETLKTEAVDNCNLDISSQTKAEDKVEDIGGQVPSVPLASGQTYAFTTFPTQCDPSSFSYVLQSSTVMHLAHTQTASSIAPDSGRRSQGTSPLHCATPSPVPCSVQVTEDEEESDADTAEVPAGQGLPRGRSVTTAIQVDMDSQTNSEEDEEEPKIEIGKLEESKVEMSDSANQTESVASESPKSDRENEAEDIILNEQTNHQSTLINEKEDQLPLVLAEPVVESETVVSISIKEDIVHSEPGMEIVTSETELAPSLPVESKPVMDFIDHHGLNLLVDSIEEFASREQGETQKDADVPVQVTTGFSPVTAEIKESEFKDKLAVAPVEDHRNSIEKFNPSKYKTIDPSCTDGLGLLCALAEQRFFEEALNIDENKSKLHQKELQDSTSSVEDTKPKIDVSSSVREQSNSNDSFLSSCSSSQDYEEVSELDMRARLTELQKKYREKQRELELLKNQREREGSDDDDYISNSPKPPRTSTPIKNYSSHPKSAPTFREHLLKNSISKPWPKKQKRLESETEKTNSKMIKKAKAASKREREYTQKEEEHGKIPSITLVHETSASISSNDSNASSGFSNESRVKKTNRMQNYNAENSSESVSCTSKDESCSQDQDYDKNDKTKTPVFDETAWFVRRSERIFLSDARSIPSSTPDKNAKKSSSNSSQKVAGDVPQKEKKESVKSLKLTKCPDDSETRKRRKRGRNKLHISKQYISSESGDSSSSDNEESENENSDGASSTSENMPLSTLVEQTTNKTPTERKKRHSVDSACSDISSGQSEDIPLSVLLNGQKDESLPELKSCILQSAELHENARLLVLDEGLFYAGNITKSGEPDVYGILIDGDRAARPHLFSKEEILNAAVLEVKPVDKRQLPEGTRICAFWSQQYRCLYPGTVTKASSPMPDSSMLYVEFDDGDSGRIPINDIRMLPPDFPIVSMEPNPFMILGKRRSRAQSQNSCGTNDAKSGNESSQGSEKDKSELKKQKSAEKLNKKSANPDGKNKDSLKRKRSPSASNRSRSSSSHGRSETKISRSEGGEEDKSKKSTTKSDDTKPKDDKSSTDPKPKKHKKHKEDHHKHHHHHHHKHHHKKHKTDKHDRRSSNDSVISSNTSISCDSPTSVSSRVSNPEQELFVLENSKSDLTVKIKKSPSPHTNPEDAAALAAAVEKKTTSRPDSPNESVGEPVKKKTKKAKLQDSQNKPAKRKERVPSIEKSKIAAFLPVRQLWRWSGKSFRKPGAKGKAKKEFYRAIQRGKETIRVGDCAVFLSTGRPHLPYIGRIETMWESWGGKMDVKVKWFYHPEETKSGKKLSQLKGALFQSPHFDENDVQTISHKCEVLAWDEYQQKKHPENKYGSLFDNNDTYFLAGTYDPILGTLILEPGVPANPPSNALDL